MSERIEPVVGVIYRNTREDYTSLSYLKVLRIAENEVYYCYSDIENKPSRKDIQTWSKSSSSLHGVRQWIDRSNAKPYTPQAIKIILKQSER